MPHHQRMQHATALPEKALMPDAQEIPATAPIFEGYLYLRGEKKRWQWRLFRFDGSKFTCLSTRKVKLPPKTSIDTSDAVVTLQLNPSTSFNTSLTSPLIATLKDKTQRLVVPDADQFASPSLDQPVLASYYQLPKWTIDVTHISAISVLTRSKKRTPFTPASTKPKCFCVRTYDGQCYIMKAEKYIDLERWLFVLTKMWKFAQTLRGQMTQVAPTTHSAVYPHDRHIASSPPRPPLHQYQYHRPELPPHEEAGKHPSTMRSLAQPTRTDEAHPAVESSPYDKKYRSPTLSAEKMQWIDEWRASLVELANYDSELPPIESIPDDMDDQTSASGMTSISARDRTRRRPSTSIRRKPSRRSIRSRKNGANTLRQEMPLTDHASSPLKKKRSDEVKNWISSKPDGHDQASPPDLDFFKDAMEGGSSPSGTSESMQAAAVRYHGSIRGKNVHVVTKEGPKLLPQPQTINSFTAASEQLYSSSPLQSLAKMDSTRDLQHHVEHTLKQQRQQQLEDEDENMSLADLQKSLRRMSTHDALESRNAASWNRSRITSASSILDRRAFRPSLSSPQPIVAPAVPPVPLASERPAFYFAPPMMMDTKKKNRQTFDIKTWHQDATPKSRPQSWIPSMTTLHKRDNAHDIPFRTPADLESTQYK